MRRALIALALVVFFVIVGVGFLFLFPKHVLQLGLALTRKKAGLERKEINLTNGLHYVYLEGGRGEPLMLLHGFGANKDVFTAVASYLSGHCRVIVPDIIGFGESAHPLDANYSPAAQAERLRLLAQSLGITKLHLGGNSMGGQIALTYAALHPEEVLSLWLLSPAGVSVAPQSELQKAMARAPRNPVIVRSTDDMKRLLAFTARKPPSIPRPILKIMAAERIRNAALEERIFSQTLADAVERRIAGMMIPSLIVWGSADRALHPANAEILHQLMPRSEMIVMPGLGHVPMMEKPKETAGDYLRFRESLDKR